MKKRLIKRTLFNTEKLNNQQILYYSDGSYEMRSSYDSKWIITKSEPQPYICAAYAYLLKSHDLKNKKINLVHLGSGFGYDLLYVSKLLKNNQIEACKLTGVDITNYSTLSVSKNDFHHPINFHVCDAIKFIEKQTPSYSDYTVLFIDLYDGDAKVQSFVYDNSFWKKIHRNIDPNIVIVNTTNGAVTFHVVSQILDIASYRKIYGRTIEVFSLKGKTDEGR